MDELKDGTAREKHGMTGIARTPQPPYVAVIFSNQRSALEPTEYAATAERMLELAAEQPGYLGVESVHDESGFGITISYWTDEAAVAGWRDDAEHLLAQRLGRQKWYDAFFLRVARVESARDFTRVQSQP